MVTLFNKTENGQFKCVEIVRDHNNNQVENMFLISISALLMVIGLAETQKPPVLAQTSLSSKGLPARNFQSQQSRNSQVNSQTQASITYPDWNTWKKQFNKSYSPSEEAKAKKNYILNLMFLVDTGLLYGSQAFSVSQFDANDMTQFKDQVPLLNFEDFVLIYNKKYSSETERAQRKKVFEQNYATYPLMTQWSDWTTDEFSSILPAKLTTYKTGNKVTHTTVRKNDNTVVKNYTVPEYYLQPEIDMQQQQRAVQQRAVQQRAVQQRAVQQRAVQQRAVQKSIQQPRQQFKQQPIQKAKQRVVQKSIQQPRQQFKQQPIQKAKQQQKSLQQQPIQKAKQQQNSLQQQPIQKAKQQQKSLQQRKQSARIPIQNLQLKGRT